MNKLQAVQHESKAESIALERLFELKNTVQQELVDHLESLLCLQAMIQQQQQQHNKMDTRLARESVSALCNRIIHQYPLESQKRAGQPSSPMLTRVRKLHQNNTVLPVDQ